MGIHQMTDVLHVIQSIQGKYTYEKIFENITNTN